MQPPVSRSSFMFAPAPVLRGLIICTFTILLTSELATSESSKPESNMAESSTAESNTPSQSSISVAQELSSAFEHVAGVITPSVVNIIAKKNARPMADRQGPGSVPRGQAPHGRSAPFGRGQSDPFLDQFRDFFGDEFPGFQGRPQEDNGGHGVGTGVIVDTRGYILTNNHVVDGADEISVRLHDQTSYTAEVVGRDPRTDLAVVRINAKDLGAATLGDSDNLKIGEWVVAAGNPFGLENSITAGIVSAKGRSIMGGGQFEDFIQTDAAINPGNSGGPLLNLRGEVIGINTAIFSRSGGYMGIGFAIPMNMAKSVMNDLIANGKVVRGWLGVAIQDLSEDLAKSFNFSGKDGALVGQIQPESPAVKAGLLQGDIIISMDGIKIKNVNQLRNLVAKTIPTTVAKLEVFRAAKTMQIPVTIGELPIDGVEASVAVEDEVEPSALGIQIENLSPELARRLRSSRTAGIVVTAVEPGGVAAEAGIQPQDIITNVNGEEIKTAAQFRTLVIKAALKRGLRVVIESQGMQRFAFLKIAG